VQPGVQPFDQARARHEFGPDGRESLVVRSGTS
jgi:hypothetical protein